MAGNLNKVFLLGNLTRDPELKHTGQGTSVCSFSIATNRSYKGSDGEFKKEVSFFNIIVWGKSGENCAKYLAKGKSVLVEGRLATRSYEASDGSKKYVTEIVADNVQFLSGGNGEEKQGKSQAAQDAESFFGGEASDDEDSMPF